MLSFESLNEGTFFLSPPWQNTTQVTTDFFDGFEDCEILSHKVTI